MKNAVFNGYDAVRTEVSEESVASIIKVIRIGDLGTTLAITSNRSTPQRNIEYVVSISQQRASVASYC
jgi:hypothetical protein